jgi:putative ABC transport system permease protein
VNLRRRVEDDLENDIREHIEIEIRENIERGMSPDEARCAAMRKFGNPIRVAEETRAVWRPEWLTRLRQDARYAARGLRRNPAFTAASILTLALGIGMSTAVFSVVSAALIKPLPYPDPDRLVWVALNNRRFHFEASSAPDFSDWREQARSFEEMTGYLDIDSTVQDGAESTKNAFIQITPEVWRMTGAHAALGRLFSDRDRQVLVLTWKMFQQRFGGDSRMIGRAVRVDGREETIIGVLPKDFRFLLPTGSEVGMPGGIHSEAEVFAPNIITPELRSRSGGILVMYAVGRLKTGISAEKARAEIRDIQTRLIRQEPSMRGFYAASEPVAVSLKEKLVGASRRSLLTLLAAAAFVVLIAFANFGNLCLARATARQREIATRIAIGAGRGRMIRQFMVEGVMLAGLGGVLGIGFAYGSNALLVRMSAAAVPRLAEAGIDWRVLLFAVGVAMLAGILFGLLPLVSFSGTPVYAALKDGVGNSSARLRLRRVLVAVEMAIAIVLLAGAGLMLKSFARMYEHPAGFEPQDIGTMKVFLSGPGSREPENGVVYARRVLETVGRIPGVKAAAVMNAAGTGAAQVDGLTFPPGQAPMVRERSASSGYARVVGLPLISGRWMKDGEAAPVVMVNEAFVRRVFAGADPIGRKVHIGHGADSTPAEIVGVVGDLKVMRLDAEAEPEVLIPFEHTPTPRRVGIIFKTPAPTAVIPEVRRAVARIDPAQPPYEVMTLEQALADSIAPRRFDLLLLGAFAASAVLLALIGIYGVMSYAVAQRTREIGLRMAIGARPPEILSMILKDAMAVAITGIVAGGVAALALTRMMTALLYNVSPNDPGIFAAVIIGLAATCLAASWIPALRAARVEPLQALRCE